MRLIYVLICLFFVHITVAQTFIEQDTLLGIMGSYNTGVGSGGGISFADFNEDGYDDLTFCTGDGSPLQFYTNQKTHFEPVSLAGINYTGFAKQAIWIDVENDGDKDLFVTGYGVPNAFYINDGNNNFTESAAALGILVSNNNSFGATFGDLNKDGYLDIYISNIVMPNEMYVYNPSLQQYQNISSFSGTSNSSYPTFCSSFVDYDHDGDLDIYVSNDGNTIPNAMFRNNGNLTFTDISAFNGSGISISSMNTATADYNNDGFWDIYCTNFGGTNSELLTGSAAGTYTNMAMSANVTFNRFGWAANFADFNNDSYEDLYVSGSFVSASAPSGFYLNMQDGTFTEPFRNTGGIDNRDTLKQYCNAIGDFNNDGKLDIAASGENDSPFRLFTNFEENDNSFIKLNLKGTQSNIEGIGTLIEVWNNNSKRIFQKHSSNGFLFQNSETIHIGFENQMQFDSIVVKWPFLTNKDVLLPSMITEGQLHCIEELNGVISTEGLTICKPIHQVIINPIPSQSYHSITLTESSSTILTGSDVQFRSENSIELGAGFEVQLGAVFCAEIGNCD